MVRLIHAVLNDPLLYGLAGFALVLVGGLLLSDWRDKRRKRAILAMRRQLREQRTQRQAGITTVPTERARTPAVSRPPVRLFRWELVLAALVLSALLVHTKVNVSARGPAVSLPGRVPAVHVVSRPVVSVIDRVSPWIVSNSVTVTATNWVSSRAGVPPVGLGWRPNPLSFLGRPDSILNLPPNGRP